MVESVDNILSNVPHLDTTYPHKISLSEIGTLLRCKKKYDYAYRQGLVPTETPGYFSKGTYLHLLMAEFLTRFQQGEDCRDIGVLGAAAIATMQQEKDGRPASVVSLDDQAAIHTVVALYLRDLDMRGVEVLAVEQEFLVDIGLADIHNQDFDDGRLYPVHGFIDAVLRVGTEVWLVEHKTAGRAWSQGNFDFAYQPRVYAEAYEHATGERPAGIQYNFFLPKRVDTHAIYVSPQESRLLLAELGDVVAMRNRHVPIREPHWGCTDCQYKNLCVGELVTGDTSLELANFIVDVDKRARFAIADE